jgi:hypothetical protein
VSFGVVLQKLFENILTNLMKDTYKLGGFSLENAVTRRKKAHSSLAFCGSSGTN